MRLAVTLPLLVAVACSSDPDPYQGTSCRPLPGPITCGPCGPGETMGMACYGSTERPCACPVADAGGDSTADASPTPGPDAAPADAPGDASAAAGSDAPADVALDARGELADVGGELVGDVAADVPADVDPLETRVAELRITVTTPMETFTMPVTQSCRASAAEVSFGVDYGTGRPSFAALITASMRTFGSDIIDIAPAVTQSAPYTMGGVRRINVRVVGMLRTGRVEALVLGCPFT